MVCDDIRRDSLIVSLQNMIVNTGLARGALKKLGQFQAQAMDDYRDAEPGKILHELRFGELAHFHRVPAHPLLRNRRCNSAVPDRPRRSLEVARQILSLLQGPPGASRIRCLEWIRSRSVTSTATDSRNTRPGRARDMRTSVGKTSGDAVVLPGSVPRSNSLKLYASCKATCSMRGIADGRSI